MTAAFFLLQNVNLSGEVVVRMNGTGFSDNLTTLDVLTVDAAEKDTCVVARLSEVEGLTEHFDTGNDGSLGFLLDTDDFDGVLNLDGATLNSAGSNGATAGDGEHVFDRHKEGLVGVANGIRDIAVYRVHKFENAFAFGAVDVACGSRFERLKRRAADNGGVVAVEVVLAEQFADFHFDEVEHLGIVDLVGLVHEYDDTGNADLTSEQDVLFGLGHCAVGSRDNEDRAIHLSSAGDHVLDVVGVARAVDVSVVTLSGFVLDVSGVYRDASCFLFGRLIDFVVAHLLRKTFCRKGHGDSGGKGGFTMVDVTDGTDVNVGLSSVEFCLCHCYFSSEIIFLVSILICLSGIPKAAANPAVKARPLPFSYYK